MSNTEYDAIGTLILPAYKHGKYKIQRVAVSKGKLTVLSEVTDDRSLSATRRVASEDLDMLVTELSRGQVVLAQPKQMTFKFESENEP